MTAIRGLYQHIHTLIYNPTCLIMVMVIYPLLFIWQGIDLTDMGYYLATYQRVFDQPPTVLNPVALFRWLTLVTGGLWQHVLGYLGVIGFKIAAVVTLYFILLFTYLTLKDHFNRTQLLFALLLTMMYITKAIVTWIDNNLFTSLYFVVASYLLMKGLKKQSAACVFLAALVIGLNIFIRLPNILGFSFILIPLFYGYFHRFSRRQNLRLILLFTSGFLSGLILVILAVYLVGHFALFSDAFQDIFRRMSNKSDYHSTNTLFIFLIKDAIKMIVLSLLSIGAIVACSIFLSRRQSNLYYS